MSLKELVKAIEKPQSLEELNSEGWYTADQISEASNAELGQRARYAWLEGLVQRGVLESKRVSLIRLGVRRVYRLKS